MRNAILFGAAFAVCVCAQPAGSYRSWGSFTGFGNINYPGTGRAPTIAAPGFTPPSWGMRQATGARSMGTFSMGAPMYGGYRSAPRTAHPAHGAGVIVPVPVIIGVPMEPDPGQEMAPPPEAPPPVVIINQGYRPERANPVFRDYSRDEFPAPPPSALQVETEPARPTLYLIAFKDHSIVPALGYWVEGDTLSYISEKGSPNRASLSLIDREFSKKINQERSVEFSLPE